MYGLGNWGEASEHVGTKTKTQCFGHYMTTYMNSICSPLPVSPSCAMSSILMMFSFGCIGNCSIRTLYGVPELLLSILV